MSFGGNTHYYSFAFTFKNQLIKSYWDWTFLHKEIEKCFCFVRVSLAYKTNSKIYSCDQHLYDHIILKIYECCFHSLLRCLIIMLNSSPESLFQILSSLVKLLLIDSWSESKTLIFSNTHSSSELFFLLELFLHFLFHQDDPFMFCILFIVIVVGFI